MRLRRALMFIAASSVLSFQCDVASALPISTDGSAPKTWNVKTDGPIGTAHVDRWQPLNCKAALGLGGRKERFERVPQPIWEVEDVRRGYEARWEKEGFRVAHAQEQLISHGTIL